MVTSDQGRTAEMAGNRNWRFRRLALGRHLKLEFHGSNVTDNAGLSIFREFTLPGFDRRHAPTAMRTAEDGQQSPRARLRWCALQRPVGYGGVKQAESPRLDRVPQSVAGHRAQGTLGRRDRCLGGGCRAGSCQRGRGDLRGSGMHRGRGVSVGALKMGGQSTKAPIWCHMPNIGAAKPMTVNRDKTQRCLAGLDKKMHAGWYLPPGYREAAPCP